VAHNRATQWWPIVTRHGRSLSIVGSISALAGAVVAGGQSPVRTLLTVWVLSVCPGLAVVGLAALRDPLMEATLTLGLSAALDVLTAGTLTYTVGWSPNAALAFLLVLSLAGAACQAAQAKPKRLTA
jgi:hypothetical protein